MLLAILQARMSSRRLPGKVLKPILGQPMLFRQIERVRRSRSIDRLIVATSRHPSDDPLAQACAEAGIPCFRGDLDDVLGRFLAAAEPHAPEAVMRLTGDCPLADWTVIDAVADLYRRSDCDYASNITPPTFPDGLDVEVVRYSALQEAAASTQVPYDREHVTQFVYDRPERFRHATLRLEHDLSRLRFTVDTPADFDLVAAVYEHFHPVDAAFSTADVLNLIASRPEFMTNQDLAGDQDLLRAVEAAAATFASRSWELPK